MKHRTFCPYKLIAGSLAVGALAVGTPAAPSAQGNALASYTP